MDYPVIEIEKNKNADNEKRYKEYVQMIKELKKEGKQ